MGLTAMELPTGKTLLPGQAIFIPLHGMYQVRDLRPDHVHQQAVTMCDLQHCFSPIRISRTMHGLMQSHARKPASPQEIAQVLATIAQPASQRHRLGGKGAHDKFKNQIRQGTFTENIGVVQALFSLDQSDWKAGRAELYHRTLRLVAEEIAYVRNQTPQHIQIVLRNMLVAAAMTR